MRFLLRLLFIAALLAAWEAAVRLLEIPAFLLPTPSAIGAALYRGTVSGVYQENIDFDITRFKPCTFNGQRC